MRKKLISMNTNEYFFDTNIKLESDILNSLLESAKNINYKYYKTNSGDQTSLGVSSTDVNVKMTPVMKEVLKMFNSNYVLNELMFLYVPPNAYIKPHIDEVERKFTAITWCLSSVENYSPTTFHECDPIEHQIEKSDQIICNYTNNAKILNVRKTHSVKNNMFERYNVQIISKFNFNEVVKFYKLGKLFL